MERAYLMGKFWQATDNTAFNTFLHAMKAELGQDNPSFANILALSRDAQHMAET
jgi:hypothetical protein